MAGLITSYLNDLAYCLRTSTRLKKRILCEIEDHLLESVQKGQERGLTAEEAEQRAIASFGPSGLIAQQLATDIASSSVKTVSRVMLPTVICLQVVTQLGYHFLPLASRPRYVMNDSSLAWMINLYSFTFLTALIACLYAFWFVHRSHWESMMSNEIRHVIAVLAFVLTALAIAGGTSGFFMFRLPRSPSFLIQFSIVSSEMVLILLGGISVLRAIRRYIALQATTRSVLPMSQFIAP